MTHYLMMSYITKVVEIMQRFASVRGYIAGEEAALQVKEDKFKADMRLPSGSDQPYEEVSTGHDAGNINKNRGGSDSVTDFGEQIWQEFNDRDKMLADAEATIRDMGKRILELEDELTIHNGDRRYFAERRDHYGNIERELPLLRKKVDELETQLESYRVEIDKLQSERLQIITELNAGVSSRNDLQRALELMKCEFSVLEEKHAQEMKSHEQRLEAEWSEKMAELKRKAVVKLKFMKQTNDAELVGVSSSRATALEQLSTTESQLRLTVDDRSRAEKEVEVLNASVLHLHQHVVELELRGKARVEELNTRGVKLAEQDQSIVSLRGIVQSMELQLNKNKELFIQQKVC